MRPQTKMNTAILHAIVAFGAGHGTLLEVIEKGVAKYLVHNFYTLVGTTTPVPLRGTTSRALHDEIMTIRAPFDLVLTDLAEEKIMDGFLYGCEHLVSCSIHTPKITTMGWFFLHECRSLTSLVTSGLISDTEPPN